METSRLKRVLGRLDALFLGFGAMIGWGWIILSGVAVDAAGVGGAAAAFLMGSAVILVIGFTYAELASALPYAGGEHAYTDRAFGSVISFICTWSIIYGYVSVVAFEAIALPFAVAYLFPEFRIGPLWEVAGYTVHASEALLGGATAIVITLLNILGVRLAVRVQTAALVLIFAAGAALIGGGVLNLSAPPSELAWWKGAPGLLAAVIIVPFLFVGFDVIPQSAEEIDAPRRTIGTSLVWSIVLAIIFYLCIVLAVGFAPLDAGDASLATADAAGAYWRSEKVAAFVVVAGIGGILTSWNAFLIGGSRALFALGRSGQLPPFLARVHPRFGTPWPAIALIGALSVVAPLLGRSALIWIVNAGSFCIAIAYVFVAAAFLTLRRREPDLERPFRAPGGVAAGGVAFVLGLILISLYLPWSPSGLVWPIEWGLVAAWYGLGAALAVVSILMRRDGSSSR